MISSGVAERYAIMLMNAQKQNVPICKVGTLVAFARKIAQASECSHQFVPNPVGYRQTSLVEQIKPNVAKILFGFGCDQISFHRSKRPLR